MKLGQAMFIETMRASVAAGYGRKKMKAMNQIGEKTTPMIPADELKAGGPGSGRHKEKFLEDAGFKHTDSYGGEKFYEHKHSGHVIALSGPGNINWMYHDGAGQSMAKGKGFKMLKEHLAYTKEDRKIKDTSPKLKSLKLK